MVLTIIYDRSHSVFTINIAQKREEGDLSISLTAKINLVDLAGMLCTFSVSRSFGICPNHSVALASFVEIFFSRYSIL